MAGLLDVLFLLLLELFGEFTILVVELFLVSYYFPLVMVVMGLVTSLIGLLFAAFVGDAAEAIASATTVAEVVIYNSGATMPLWSFRASSMLSWYTS